MSFLRPLSYFTKRFHPKQEDAWLAYKAGMDLFLAWGRRTGKSDLFSECFIEDVEETGYPSLYMAVSQKQARRILWPKLAERLRHEAGWKPNESRLEYVYKGGPFISLKGADLRADDLAGGAYRLIGLDEYALWKKPEIRQRILAPMLADYNGQFLYGSTKRGKNHFWKLHQQALKLPKKFHVSEATIFENPFISDEGRQKVVDEYEGGAENPLYRQEILNLYVVFVGQVFALEQETYTEKRWDPGVLEHCYHFGGMDHGFDPDPTAHLWFAYNPRTKRFQVYSEYKQSRLLIEQHKDAITGGEPYHLFNRYSDIDPQILAEYESVGLSLTAADKYDKRARLLRLVTALKSGRLCVAKNCTALLEEMASLTWEDVEDEKGEDHLIDAFNYGFNNFALPESPDAAAIEAERQKFDPRAQHFDD